MPLLMDVKMQRREYDKITGAKDDISLLGFSDRGRERKMLQLEDWSFCSVLLFGCCFVAV